MVNVKDLVKTGAGNTTGAPAFMFGSWEELNKMAEDDTDNIRVFLLPFSGSATQTRHKNLFSHYNLSILVARKSALDDDWETRHDDYLYPCESTMHELVRRIQILLTGQNEINPDYTFTQQFNLFDLNLDGYLLELKVKIQNNITVC